MIKKVNVEDLKVGVFVHDFNCDWNGGNLYIEQNFIKNQSTIDILRSWGIKEVYIDIEKGLDVTRPKTHQKEGKDTVQIGQARKFDRSQVPLARELQLAKQITEDAIEIVKRVNQQVMAGEPPDVGPSYDLANRMRASINRNRDALSLLTRIRNKDEYTLYHSISVSSLVLDMCHYCQTPEHQTLDLAVGALFHDIGKTLVPQDILNKPGKLTEEEFCEIQRHVEHSVNVLSEAKGLPLECYDIALHHHERYDGKGYPNGLKKDQISYGSQLTCICDVFDAITSERCYKPAVDTVVGLHRIYEGSGIFFSKEITHDFIQCVGVYPIGTCVLLDDGRNGVVVGSTENMMRPMIQVFYDEKKKERIKSLKVDLTKTEDVIVSYVDPKKFGLTSSQMLRKFLHTGS